MHGKDDMSAPVLPLPSSKLYAHSEILGAFSDYPKFHTGYSDSRSNSPAGEVRLSDFDKHTINLILDYLYTGEIELDLAEIKSLAAAMDVLIFDPKIVADFWHSVIRSYISFFKSLKDIYRSEFRHNQYWRNKGEFKGYFASQGITIPEKSMDKWVWGQLD
jgi:hypothetical protein